MEQLKAGVDGGDISRTLEVQSWRMAVVLDKAWNITTVLVSPYELFFMIMQQISGMHKNRQKVHEARSRFMMQKNILFIVTVSIILDLVLWREQNAKQSLLKHFIYENMYTLYHINCTFKLWCNCHTFESINQIFNFSRRGQVADSEFKIIQKYLL